MLQDLEKITCVHSVSAIRCTLLFSDRDKPSHWFREYLRKEFPIERCLPKPINKGTIEGFRPTRAFFDPDESTFVWQDGRAVFIQSESPHNRARFLQLLESVVHACAETRPLNTEPLQLVFMGTNRFEFLPYNIDQFELHRYFSIVPAPSPEIRKQGVFLFQNDISQKYGNHNGDYIELSLKFPSYAPSGTNGFVDLEIATLTPCVWWLDTTKNSVTTALDTMQKLTREATIGVASDSHLDLVSPKEQSCYKTKALSHVRISLALFSVVCTSQTETSQSTPTFASACGATSLLSAADQRRLVEMNLKAFARGEHSSIQTT